MLAGMAAEAQELGIYDEERLVAYVALLDASVLPHGSATTCSCGWPSAAYPDLLGAPKSSTSSSRA